MELDSPLKIVLAVALIAFMLVLAVRASKKDADVQNKLRNPVSDDAHRTAPRSMWTN